MIGSKSLKNKNRDGSGMNSGRRQKLKMAAAPLLVLAAITGAEMAPAAETADVEVDLSAIGLRTETDDRIAPGRAPVELRYPGSEPEKRILLTPPPGVPPRPEPFAAPAVLAPAGSQPVSPRPAARPASPSPAPAEIKPAPLLPVERQPAPEPAEASAPAPAPARTAGPEPTVPEPVTETASLPPPAPAAHRLRFEDGSATLLSETRDELELIATELMRHSDRIEIQAYAGDAGDLTSRARRLSLQRGLAVRTFLVSEGVLQSRIDVRALGGVRDSGPGERVDIVLSSR